MMMMIIMITISTSCASSIIGTIDWKQIATYVSIPSNLSTVMMTTIQMIIIIKTITMIIITSLINKWSEQLETNCDTPRLWLPSCGGLSPEVDVLFQADKS